MWFLITVGSCIQAMYLVLIFVRTDSHYRPPTKLREGNVFTGVCSSGRGGGRISLVPGT